MFYLWLIKILFMIKNKDYLELGNGGGDSELSSGIKDPIKKHLQGLYFILILKFLHIRIVYARYHGHVIHSLNASSTKICSEKKSGFVKLP
jgi:hypothetical protein